MAVGAVDEDGEMDPASSSQRLKRSVDPQVPDLVMPGDDIVSANAASAGGGYRADSGTSMAAPHASGLAALLWEAFPKATVDQVESAIYQSCARTASRPAAPPGPAFPHPINPLPPL